MDTAPQLAWYRTRTYPLLFFFTLLLSPFAAGAVPGLASEASKEEPLVCVSTLWKDRGHQRGSGRHWRHEGEEEKGGFSLLNRQWMFFLVHI